MIGAFITVLEVYGALLVFLCTLIATDEVARRLRERRQRPFDWASDTLTEIHDLPERRMNEPFHPYDRYSREQAIRTDFERLLENFEEADQYRDDENRAHVLELLCSVALARVRLLERELRQAGICLARVATPSELEQERLARAQVRPHGNVVPLRRPPGAA